MTSAQVVALGDVVGLELFSYSKVKAYRSVKRVDVTQLAATDFELPSAG